MICNNNIYIPCNGHDGGTSLMLGLVLQALHTEVFDKIVLVGEEDYYSKVFAESIANEKVIIIDDSLKNKTKAIKRIRAISESKPNYLYVFSCSPIDGSTFQLNRVIIQDYFLGFIGKINTDWDVYIPPVFNWNSGHTLEALDKHNVEFKKINGRYRVGPRKTSHSLPIKERIFSLLKFKKNN